MECFFEGAGVSFLEKLSAGWSAREQGRSIPGGAVEKFSAALYTFY